MPARVLRNPTIGKTSFGISSFGPECVGTPQVVMPVNWPPVTFRV